VISGVTVVTMLVCFFHLHARLRVHWAPGIPCALYFGEAKQFAQLGRNHAARSRSHVCRHCERSEAIHLAAQKKQSISPRKKEEWIASSLRSSQ
jgi:hypothetical protein